MEFLLPKEVEVINNIDDIRLRSNLTTNKTIRLTEKSFSIKNTIQSIPFRSFSQHFRLCSTDSRNLQSDNPIILTRTDKVHLKDDCIQGSIVNVRREAILYSFAPSSPPGRKIYKEPRMKLFEKINKSVLSHKTFYLEDDDHKPVDFKRETVSFTCKLIEI